MQKDVDSIFFENTPRIQELARKCEENNAIERELYTQYEVKRGLRDLNGKGVLDVYKRQHNTSGNMENLQIKFDKLTSHDITFVGIIQTARASGLETVSYTHLLSGERKHRRADL